MNKPKKIIRVFHLNWYSDLRIFFRRGLGNKFVALSSAEGICYVITIPPLLKRGAVRNTINITNITNITNILHAFSYY